MQNTKKLKLIPNQKLTCIKITPNLKEVVWKTNDSRSITENWNKK
jgi:hypothetical protein